MGFSLKSFDRFVFRTPSIPTSELSKLLSSNLTDEELFHKLLHDYEEYNFLAAVFIAAPEFYRVMTESILSGKSLDKNHLQTLFKYFVRSCSRATPFGLFAGLGLGRVHNEDKAIRRQTGNIKVMLDSRLHASLNERLLSYAYLKKRVKFHTNSTLHEVGDKHVFVEYKFSQGDLQYQLSSIDKSYYVDLIVKKARNGLVFEELAELLKEDDFSPNEIEDFWFELIDSKIILSELFFCAYHSEYQNENFIKLAESSIHSALASSSDDIEASNFILFVSELLTEATNLSEKQFNVQHLVKIYDRIRTRFGEFGIHFDEKRIFQFDSLQNFSDLTLSKTTVNKIGEAIQALSKLNVKRFNPDMTAFITEFEKRYESQDVPLLVALSSDHGIGYPVKNASTLLKTNQDTNLSSVEIFLHNKLLKSITTSAGVIELTDEDFARSEAEGKYLPDTFSCLAQVHFNNGERLISIREVGGGSAANILARFGNLATDTREYVDEIIKYEQEVSDGLCAEIVHLPSTHSGNVLRRNLIREYSISCVSVGGHNQEIRLEDLYLRMDSGSLVLYSKSLSRVVHPKLTTAHNTGPNSIAIYQFLVALQTYEKKANLTFTWGNLRTLFTFFPRVVYKEIIISPAKWILPKSAFNNLNNSAKPASLKANISEFKEMNKLPNKFYINQGDHVLLIDIENSRSVEMFVNTLRSLNTIELTESLSDSDHQFAQDYTGAGLSHEILLGFKNTSVTRKHQPKIIKTSQISQKRTFPPGSKWVYIKMYVSQKRTDQVIKAIFPSVQQLLATGKISSWHFVRYQDPSSHIRLRFLLGRDVTMDFVIKEMNRCIESFQESGLITNVVIDTFSRELERYGEANIEKVESIFFADSSITANFISQTSAVEKRVPAILGLIDITLESIGLSLQGKLDFCQKCRDGYLAEFGSRASLRDQLAEYSRCHREMAYIAINSSKNHLLGLNINYQQLAQSYQALCGSLSKPGMNEENFRCISSCIHMSVNRMFSDNQRQQELYMYHLLFQTYRRIKSETKAVYLNDSIHENA